MNAFPKSQRLCSRKAIETLFGSGSQSIVAFPLRVVYQEAANRAEQVSPSDAATPPCQVLFSVSKRRFKHAVDRNRAKRQMREAWRRYRHILATSTLHVTPSSDPLNARPSGNPLSVGSGIAAAPSLPPLHLAFLWLSTEPLSSAFVHRKMKKLLCAVSSSFQSASTSASSHP